MWRISRSRPVAALYPLATVRLQQWQATALAMAAGGLSAIADGHPSHGNSPGMHRL